VENKSTDIILPQLDIGKRNHRYYFTTTLAQNSTAEHAPSNGKLWRQLLVVASTDRWCACMVTSTMPTAESPLLSYEEVTKTVWTAASCGRVAKVSVCRTVLWWFKSVPCQSVQCCTWIGCGCLKSWRIQSEERRNEKRERLPFCPSAGIVENNDWPVLADQLRRQTRLSFDSAILH
jgi:hypothetical protein